MSTRTSATTAVVTESDTSPLVRLIDVLHSLLPLTDSDYVILRTHDPIEDEFVYLAHARRADARALGPAFAIRQRKSASCWIQNPLDSWGSHLYTEGDDSHGDLNAYSHAEREFIRWIVRKAYFPIVLPDGNLGLITLSRGADRCTQAFDHRDVIKAWIFAQQAISDLRPDQIAGFQNAIDVLPILENTPAEADLIHRVMRCLASRYGLCWNRVWFLEETEQDSMRFVCKFCLGELNSTRWSAGLQVPTEPAASLEQELLASDALRQVQQDALFQICCNPDDPCRLEVQDYNDLLLAYAGHFSQRESAFFPLLMPLEDTIQASFQEPINQRAEDQFHPASLYWLPLTIGSRRCMVLLSQAYSLPEQTRGSRVLTSAFLYRASIILSAWDVIRASTPTPGRFRNSSEFSAYAAAATAMTEYKTNPKRRSEVASNATAALERFLNRK